MNRKFILVISALIITLALVLTACNNGNNCKHTFSDKWSCDEEYHWRAATCEHKEEYADKSRILLSTAFATYADIKPRLISLCPTTG